MSSKTKDVEEHTALAYHKMIAVIPTPRELYPQNDKSAREGWGTTDSNNSVNIHRNKSQGLLHYYEKQKNRLARNLILKLKPAFLPQCTSCRLDSGSSLHLLPSEPTVIRSELVPKAFVSRSRYCKESYQTCNEETLC